MRKNLCFLIVLLVTFGAIGQNIQMQNGTVNQCGGTISDSGGLTNSYSNDEDFILTLCPDTPNSIIQLAFTQFETEENKDVLTIYDGDSVSAPVLGNYSGGLSNLPRLIQANTSGCLTLKFVSNSSITKNGWNANVICINNNVDNGAPVVNSNRILPPQITVSTTQYTVTQLVEDVLIDSPCSLVSNIVSSTGTNFGSVNGIGSFTGGQGNFGFDKGVVLSSGSALAASGPETSRQSAGTDAWVGDADLQTAIAMANPSTNASFIKFDFTPLIKDFKFDFIFASEEYGQYQCRFTDAFAFLLTDNVTGITTNLAVIPGTTDVVSVLNVRDNAYNTGCNSSNAAFFESYYGNFVPGSGLPANTAPTNFIGHTKLMTAQAVLVPNRSYTIKLVVADDAGNTGVIDNGFDAAVFLKAGSFNLGGNLGADVTIASGTAKCLGETVVLNTNVDPGVVHEWTLNGAVIAGEVGSTLNATSSGTYGVKVDFSSSCTTSDTILVEFITPAVVTNLNNLFKCSQTSPVDFDLTVNTSEALGTQSSTEYRVSYHTSSADATADTGAIPNPTTFSGTDGQTIYVRVEDIATQNCFTTGMFTLNIKGVQANTVANMVVCDDASNDDMAPFNLENQIPTILGSTQLPADYTVTFHTGSADATADTGAISNPTVFNGTNGQVIHVRVENNVSPTCFALTSFELIVNDLPVITAIPDYKLCDNTSDGSATNGFTEFDLTSQSAALINGQTNVTATYFETQADAIANTSAIANPTTFTNGTVNTDEIFVRLTHTVNSCFQVTSFNIVVNPVPVLTDVRLVQCDEDGTPDGLTEYNLSQANAGLVGSANAADFTFEYYLNQADATGQNNAQAPSPFVNTVNPQVLVVRVQHTATGCVNYANVTLDVTATDVSSGNLVKCDDNYDGLVEFTLSDADAAILASLPAGLTVAYYENATDAQLEQNQLPNLYTNTTPSMQNIFVRVENANQCFGISSISLTVNPLPANTTVNNATVCSDNANSASVDLTMFDAQVLGMQNPADFTVSYFDSQANANANSGALASPYNTTSNAQSIYVRVTNNTTGCFITTINFVINVNPNPTAVVPTDLEVCDDNVANGFTSINLNIKNGEISGGNTSYAVTYYLSLVDAQTEMNPLAIPYTNVSNPQTVFARVEDTSTGCFATAPLKLVVQQAPIANTPQPLEYCDPDADGIGTNGFDLASTINEITGGATGLTVTFHETMPNAANNVLPIPLTGPYTNIMQNTQTIYVRIESSTIATNCASFVELQLIVYPTPQILDTPTTLEVCDDATPNGISQFDLTLNNTSILNGLPASNYNITYYSSQVNAEAGSNPITTPLTYTNVTPFTEVIWVRVEDNPTVTATGNGCYSVVAMNLLVNRNPVLVSPDPLELCDVNNPGDEKEAFTLSRANAQILGGQTGVSLTYHSSQNGADTNTDVLPNTYTNTSNPQTVFVRARNNSTGCVSTVTLTLKVNPLPSPVASPAPLTACDSDNDGIFNMFDLDSQTVSILNGESNVTITYHETNQNAIDDVMNVGGSPYENIVAYNQNIYVRAENNTTGCFRVVILPLQVLNSPVIPQNIDPLDGNLGDNTYVVCDDDMDGINQFDLDTAVTPVVLGAQNAANYPISYYTSLVNAEGMQNPIATTGNYTNTSNPQTIWVRLDSNGNGCSKIGSFVIRVENPPVAVTPTELEACDELDANHYENNNGTFLFDLTVKNNEITGSNAALTVSYHLTEATAASNTVDIPDATMFTNTVNGAQTVWARVEDSTTGCYSLTTLTVRVIPRPSPSQNPMDLQLCDDTSSPDGIEVFDLTLNEAFIINSETNVNLTYYTSEANALAGTSPIANPAMHSNEDPNNAGTGISPQTIYVRMTSGSDVMGTGGTGCFTLVNFDVIVNPLPVLPTANLDIKACEVGTTGMYTFNLTQNTATILAAQNGTNYVVSYYETLAAAQNGTPQIATPAAYTSIANPQTIFVNIRNTTTGCDIATLSFVIEVNEAAIAHMYTGAFEVCDDNMEFDNNTTNDTAVFDLNTQNAQVLNMQDPANYSVSYYLTQADADAGLAATQLPLNYTNITNPQVIYVRVDNNTMTGTPPVDSSYCYATTPLTLQVNPLPSFNLDDMYVICASKNGSQVLPDDVINTGLSASDYSFEWYLDGVVIPGQTAPSIAPLVGGNYAVVVTYLNPNTGCSNVVNDPNAMTIVEVSTPPTITAQVGTNAFADSHMIEVTATGDGISVFEFSLDGGAYVENTPNNGTYTFTNVSIGEHIVRVRDKNGCGYEEATVMVMGYPLFFTPNGDGYNDTWNISSIANQPDATIYIYDRMGKLLKQLSPTGPGWDGTYNNKLMPTSDYWFTVEYREPNSLSTERKIFKSHFTLKR